eukprot:TRINITY_DN9968_c0_g2_i1.p1 TRINITY_DN9968_c0_g2~~TRINITY_DN9968_c0_g2_i1.p1  ORF type:complete len:229 (-),score=57.17 TRINITY_DN9968_c0_g2_i1:148-834(-)
MCIRDSINAEYMGMRKQEYKPIEEQLNHLLMVLGIRFHPDYSISTEASDYFLSKIQIMEEEFTSGDKPLALFNLMGLDENRFKSRQILGFPRLKKVFLERYAKALCELCQKKTDEQYICMICGKACCLKKCPTSEKRDKKGNLTTHAMRLHAGVGLFIGVRDSMVYVSYFGRSYSEKSPLYIEEEDKDGTTSLVFKAELYEQLFKLAALHRVPFAVAKLSKESNPHEI